MTFLTSCGTKADDKKTAESLKASSSALDLPDNNNLNFEEIATEIISSDSIDGIKTGTTYKTLLSRYGEPTSKTDESHSISGYPYQQWDYQDLGAMYEMVKIHDDYIIFNIMIYGNCPFSTERDIKVGSPVNNVIKAYGKQYNSIISTPNMLVFGTSEKGMTITIKDGKVNSLSLTNNID